MLLLRGWEKHVEGQKETFCEVSDLSTVTQFFTEKCHAQLNIITEKSEKTKLNVLQKIQEKVPFHLNC
jgi:uncharacterized coiled-coil protein SlyX